jgi:serine/threonine protein kinase
VNERWERVGRLFDRIAAVAPSDRETVLGESPEAEDVKSEVRSLLAAHDRAEGFLDRRTGDDMASSLAHGVSSPTVTSPENATRVLPADALVGPYRIKRVAGRGGMGVVYEAEDLRLHRRVALKALPTAFAGEEAQRLRLRQEARAAAALMHPGIAIVYALEEIEGGLFISSEFLEGETLREEMNHGPVPVDRALATVTAIAAALAAAHERGIVHRDLKPENIVRATSGALKILDFGLAQFEEAAQDLTSRSRLTEQGLVIGTPAYMAPEQLLGHPTDFHVDHFSLGVMLYELCTGTHPFGGASLPSTIARILASNPQLPPPPRQLPAPVWAIIDRCLRKDPAKRFASTRDLLDAITSASAMLAPPAPLAPRAPLAPLAPLAPEDALKWWRFHQLTAAVAYWAIVWPVWHVHRALGQYGLFFFLATVAVVVVGASLRLHLWFSSRVYPDHLRAQRRAVRWWIRCADVTFAALLIAGGIALPEQQRAWAAVLISYGIGVALAFSFIEPATARAAFQEP